MKKVHLLLIDPQMDFCRPDGALSVANAEHDMERVGSMIKRIGKKFNDIHVTLDQHHRLDVAHPLMWKGSDGAQPTPGTLISTTDIENGMWTPVHPGLTSRMIDYTKSLEQGGRYPLCIWNPHCLIGTPGAAIVPEVMEALDYWVEEKKGIVDFVSKGSNIFTEHYSGVKAEVPDPSDPSTQLNSTLIGTLETADEIAIAGEAGSHCLANTVRDIANGFSDESYIQKFTLLTDGTSPVVIPGVLDCTSWQEDFIIEMKNRGMKTATTVDFLA